MSKSPSRNAYKRAANALDKSRKAMETLLAESSDHDHYVFGQLGPILAELQSAQAIIEELSRQQRYNSNGRKF